MMRVSVEKVQAAIRKGVFAGMRIVGHRPGKAIRNLHYGPEPGQSLDIYLPGDDFRGIQMVFLHGGSWQSGHKDEYAYLGAALAAFGISCAVVGYRLFPQVRYPQFVEDVAHAISWLRRDGLRYGFSDAPVYLMGHSAGAHIACLMAMDDRYRDIAGLEEGSVAGVIGLSGVYRFKPETSAVYMDIFAAAQADLETVKPINYVGKDKVPLLMLHGDADEVIGIRNAQQMLEAARKAGQPAVLHSQPGYGHARPIFDFLPFMPNHQKMMAVILSFVSSRSVGQVDSFNTSLNKEQFQ
ncbi:alpha/beta hydrolase [Ketobacter sp. MCCC 1A13808]|uniref:alpha/beta hydrolase n=1 Tax=Ketobacter sp. MCCC 1A13808 TaxID=2602738 RepID=UPI000F22E5CA|nr:alpha/beta hydrolase [Ketobacter sp. MCCC 1A13808]MVF14656.1 alpha/beta hydrolase [Ketobacter sp. MCCC 1A13808]RLP53973.1 MAG: alpha/beta hydrolase [Ketobacter sp.]